jgi:mRNA interferase RelE/StbE
MKINLNRNAIKFLSKQEKSVSQRIRIALEGLKKQPPLGDIVKMKGRKDTYRLRVGTYRVVYNIDFQERVIYILAIDNRGDIY